MKKLHLIRHAKSSWADGTMADINRPLNQRGIASCRVMAPQMVKAGCCFKQVFCSPAVRAQSTIEQLSQHLPKAAIAWQIEHALYTFDSEDLWTWWRGLDDTLSEVVIVGHNQALTDFCNQVGDQPIENIPTCGYVQLAFEHRSWQALSAGSAQRLSFLKPKMFM
ncbi:MAG: phosphoglycerate mutase [Phormidesmis sp. RL_2_1]|nr:phosphoglycerate mutase [Phormidesmis sp. RL_2_1]